MSDDLALSPTDGPELDRTIRFLIYRVFAAAGSAPGLEDLATAAGVPRPAVEASLDRLAAAHQIVLAPGSRNLWMAHPFSAVPTEYPVRVSATTYWANCAWDALGIPSLLGVDSETTTRCPDCGDPLRIRVSDGRAEPRDAVVHFAVPPRRFWENVGFT